MGWKSKATAEQKAQAELKRQKLKELTDKLAEMSPEELQAFSDKVGLITCEGHPVSPRNTMLAYMQVEEGRTLTMIGGFKQFLDKGRLVVKGKSIHILAPNTFIKKDKSGNALKSEDGSDIKGTAFRTINMWDISDTVEMTEEEIQKNKERKQKEFITGEEKSLTETIFEESMELMEA